MGFEEVETVIMQGTRDALLSAIIGNFPRNRNRKIREIHGQTSDFAVGASTFCSNIQITNQLTFQDWLSLLPSPGNYIPRIQLIRSRIPGGPPDSPPLGPSESILQAELKDIPGELCQQFLWGAHIPWDLRVVAVSRLMEILRHFLQSNNILKFKRNFQSQGSQC